MLKKEIKFAIALEQGRGRDVILRVHIVSSGSRNFCGTDPVQNNDPWSSQTIEESKEGYNSWKTGVI